MQGWLESNVRYTLNIVEFIDKIIWYSISKQKSTIIVNEAPLPFFNETDNKFVLKLEEDIMLLFLRPNYILLFITQLALNIERLFQSNANSISPKLKFSRPLLPSKVLLISTKTMYRLTFNVRPSLCLQDLIMISILFYPYQTSSCSSI